MKRFFFSLFLVVFAVQIARANAPQTMSYQGVLKDGSGQPVADGNYSLSFAIYTTGGSQLWTETHSTVATSAGVFSVILGSQGTPLNLAFDQAYELGITVGGNPELSPRMPLASAPYSLNTRGISHASGITVIGNSARVVDNSGLTVEESGSTGLGAHLRGACLVERPWSSQPAGCRPSPRSESARRLPAAEGRTGQRTAVTQTGFVNAQGLSRSFVMTSAV